MFNDRRFFFNLFFFSDKDTSGKWEFKCPNVGDASNYRRITVTWTLNNQIWLKIDHGNLTVAKQLTQFTKNKDSPNSASKIYTISANDARYKFFYNEPEGDFFMYIQNGKPDDIGVWQCHVTLYKTDEGVEEISSQDTFELSGVTRWPYWNIDDGSDTDTDDNGIFDDSIMPIIVDDGFGSNSTATYIRYSYLVPLFITFPAVIIF